MKKKVFSLLLAGMLTFSMGTTAYATEDAIADMQAQKQQAEAGLAQTQANIDSLQSKKQELENYLSDLNTQYEDLTMQFLNSAYRPERKRRAETASHRIKESQEGIK